MIAEAYIYEPDPGPSLLEMLAYAREHGLSHGPEPVLGRAYRWHFDHFVAFFDTTWRCVGGELRDGTPIPVEMIPQMFALALEAARREGAARAPDGRRLL